MRPTGFVIDVIVGVNTLPDGGWAIGLSVNRRLLNWRVRIQCDKSISDANAMSTSLSGSMFCT